MAKNVKRPAFAEPSALKTIYQELADIQQYNTREIQHLTAVGADLDWLRRLEELLYQHPAGMGILADLAYFRLEEAASLLLYLCQTTGGGV